MAGAKAQPKSDDNLKYLRALLILQLNANAKEADKEEPEFLLTRAGFSQKETAKLLGITQPAVSQTLSRAKNKKPGTGK